MATQLSVQVDYIKETVTLKRPRDPADYPVPFDRWLDLLRAMGRGDIGNKIRDLETRQAFDDPELQAKMTSFRIKKDVLAYLHFECPKSRRFVPDDGAFIPRVSSLKPGDPVRVLSEYNLMSGTVVSVGPKNIKINFPAQKGFIAHDKSVAPEKVARADESIAVVWEQWKGANGRGGYRLERELFPEYRRPAAQWPHQALIKEVDFGFLNPQSPTHLLPVAPTAQPANPPPSSSSEFSPS